MLKLIIAVVAALSLSACATCREHPVVCGVAGAFVVGSVAVMASAHGHGGSPGSTRGFGLPEPVCTTTGAVTTCH
jgi:hypothetical protein